MDFVHLFLKKFREAGGEARALEHLSRMTKKPEESVRKYGQRVKALIQKLMTEIAQSVQVEWYVTGFPEKMGFQIRQTRMNTLKGAMEAAQNYENFAQSLLKSQSEKKGKRHRRRRRKYTSSSESNPSSKSETTTSASSSSDGKAAGSSKIRNRCSRNKKKPKKEGVDKGQGQRGQLSEDDEEHTRYLAAIQVNLAESQKPKRTIPNSRANVWYARCGESRHFPLECTQPLQKRIQYMQPEEEVYYMYPDEEEEEEDPAPVYQVQSTYGRGRAPAPFVRTPAGPRMAQSGVNQGMDMQPRYPSQLPGYSINCGSPDHYATSCPFPRQGQGAPQILPCHNCQEYGHYAPQCQKPVQARPVFKQVDVPPWE